MSRRAVNQPLPTAAAKRRRVIEAAVTVFRRYGFARTTMADVAQSAAISRAALYLMFPGKEDVFREVIHHMNAGTLDAIRVKLPDCPTLEAKLLLACELWGARGFDLVKENPDAKDLFDLAFEPVQEIYLVFQAFLAELLGEPVTASAVQAQPEEMARLLAWSLRGFKDMAHDGSEIRRMIALQIELMADALKTSAGAARA
jgi:AcrR family transcriptional regulator